MLVEFYKGPASGYDAGSHSNGIYQCTDTGDTYIFGVLNKGGKGIRVLDFDTDFKGGSGNMDGDLYNTLKQELSDGVPMFIKMMEEENYSVIYPLIVSKSHALASPNPEVLDFQIAVNSIMEGSNLESGISVMANFLEVRGDTFEISLSSRNLPLLTEEKDHFRVLANNGEYIGTLLNIGSIPEQAYNVVKEVVKDKNLTSGTWETFKTYVNTGTVIRTDAYWNWDYYFTGTSFGTFRYNSIKSTATITTYSLVDESLENPAEQLSKQYATIYNISSEGSVTSTTTNVPKLQYDESGVIVGAGNGTEEKSITLLTGGDGSKVLADNGSYISSQDSRVYVWDLSETPGIYLESGSSYIGDNSGEFTISPEIFKALNNAQIVIGVFKNSNGPKDYCIMSICHINDTQTKFMTLLQDIEISSFGGEVIEYNSITVDHTVGGDGNYTVTYEIEKNISRFSINLNSLVKDWNSGNPSAYGPGLMESEYLSLQNSYYRSIPITLELNGQYGNWGTVLSLVRAEDGYILEIIYQLQGDNVNDSHYPKILRVKVAHETNGTGSYPNNHPVTLLSVLDLNNISNIVSSGEGNQFLSDNGTYKTISIPDSVTSIKVGENADSLIPESGVVTLPAATIEADGIMSKTDKTSLDELKNLGIIYLNKEEFTLLYNPGGTLDESLFNKISADGVRGLIVDDSDSSSGEGESYYYYANVSKSQEENAIIISYNTSSIMGSSDIVNSFLNTIFTEFIISLSDRKIGSSNYSLNFHSEGNGTKVLANNGEYIDAEEIQWITQEEFETLCKPSSTVPNDLFNKITAVTDDRTKKALGVTGFGLLTVINQESSIKILLNGISDNGNQGFNLSQQGITLNHDTKQTSDLIQNSIILSTHGTGNKYLNNLGQYVEIPVVTTEVSGLMIPEDKTFLDSLSGLGFVLLSEEETNELLKNDSSTAISESLYTKLSDPNTHLVIFTNVSKEGGLDGGSSETERIYYMLEKRVIATGNTISLIYSNSYGTSGATGNISYSTYDIDTDKIVTRSNFHLTFELMGDGDKFLSDDGTYKVIEVPTEATQISLSNSYVPSDLENESLIPAVGDTVETVIGKLHKAILDNEEVVASAFTKLNSSCGFNNNGEYVPVGSITTGTNSLGGAISKLDSSISSIKSFRDITVGDSTLTPESSSDTLTLTQGEGITLTPGGDNKSLTISASNLVSRITAVESELQGVNALADELLTLTE